MRAALAAEWLRLRGRRDLLILVVALPLLVIVGLVSSFLSISGSFSWGPPGTPAPPEVLAEIARRQAGYAFPADITTAFGFGPILALVGILLGAFVVGAEFDAGTLRGALLANGRRERFLAARWVSLITLMWLLVVEVTLAGLAASGILVVLGEHLSDPGVSLLGALASVAVWLGAGPLLVVLGATAALLARSTAGGILLAFVYAFAELLLNGAPIFREGVLQAVKGISLSGSVTWLAMAAQDAGRPTLPAGGFGDVSEFFPPVPAEVSALALLAWLVGLSVLAAWRMRGLDVVE